MRFRVIPGVLMALAMALCGGVSATAAAAKNVYYFYVFSNPTEGREAEYNTWYDTQHIYDVVGVPGFKTAQRFVRNDHQMIGGITPVLPKYLAVYTIVTPDLEAVMKEVGARVKSGRTVISPAYDVKTSDGYIYKIIGKEMVGVGGEPSGAQAGTVNVYRHIVFAQPVAGQDAEFNRWYDDDHMPAMGKVPGFTGGRRMALVDRGGTNHIAPAPYIAMFDIKTRDDQAVFAAFKAAAKSMTSSPTMDRPKTRGYTYRAIGPVVMHDDPRPAKP
jgi:hypothetical protein